MLCKSIKSPLSPRTTYETIGWKHANFTAEREKINRNELPVSCWTCIWWGARKDGGCQWIPFKDTQTMSYVHSGGRPVSLSLSTSLTDNKWGRLGVMVPRDTSDWVPLFYRNDAMEIRNVSRRSRNLILFIQKYFYPRPIFHFRVMDYVLEGLVSVRQLGPLPWRL